MSLPGVLLELHGGPALQAEGFAGVAVQDPLLISIVPAACTAGRRDARALYDAIALALRTRLGSVPQGIAGAKCGTCGHCICLLADSRKVLRVLVGARDPSCAFGPLREGAGPGRESERIFPVFPAGSHPEEVLPRRLAALNARFWAHSPAELVDDVLAVSGLVSEENRVFISYRRKDTQPLAEQLFDRLSREGFDVFLDRFRVPPAVDFQARLTEELAHKSMVLVLESRRIMESEWTRYEIDFAVSHRLGLFALHMPDGPAIAGIDEKQRYRLRDEHFGGGRRSRRLRAVVLRDVARRIREEHTRALVWRRDLLRTTMQNALLAEGVRGAAFGPGGVLSASSVSPGKPRQYAVYVTSRPPELPDFHHTHGSCADPYPRGVIVGPDAHLAGIRRTRLDWLSDRSSIRYFDEGQMSQVAQAIARGML
jgi:hypothetical protein